MEYLTSEEAARKWDISSRRVTTLCKAGRIDGVMQKGGIWLIPDDARKPESMKRGRKKGKNGKSDGSVIMIKKSK